MIRSQKRTSVTGVGVVISSPVPCYHGARDNTSVGHPIDGDCDGPAGGDYVATISGRRVTAGGPMERVDDGGLRTEESRSSRARIDARLVATVVEIHFGT